MRDQFLI